MKRLFFLMYVIVFVSLPASSQKDEINRMENAGKVMVEILNVPDNIPADILDKAECVIVLPSVMKFAIGFGGSYGRGVMTCRSGMNFNGPWSAPSMMALEGGSFGFQLGGQATDFVLLVMNQRGAHSILTSQVKLGADMAAAAGPKGRSAAASTDVTLRAEILSYSRSRGLFAGISLEGSTLRPDNDGNERLYGKGTTAKEIVINSAIRPSASAKFLLATLNRSPRETSPISRTAEEQHLGAGQLGLPQQEGLGGTEMKRIRFASTGVLLLLLGITAPIYAQQQQDQNKQEQPRAQQRQQDQNKQQQPRAQQQQQMNRPSQQSQRVQQGEERSVWQQHRARSWQAEHKTWQQRGGYNGYRIPESNFHGNFGQGHGFHIYNLPLMIAGGYLRFQYSGFWFSVVDPWPEYWSDNWYENDDVYIDYSGDGYYMYNRRYPRDRIAISVYVN